MKNYDEFAEEVFREADRRLALKRKRAAAIRRYTFALASMFAIILTGTFVLKNDTVREALERRFNAQNIITDESSVTAPPADTTAPEPGTYAPVTTTETVTYPQDNISSTIVTTAVRAVSTTTAKKSHVTTSAASVSSTTASRTDELTGNTRVTTTRTTVLHYVSSTFTTKITTHTTAKTTKIPHTNTTVSPIHTTATATKTTHATATATKTTDSPQSTTSSCTTTTIAGTFVTSSTFPHTSTSSTTTIATSTNVSQTDISTQPLYPDIVLPPETADPSGNTTVPVNYRCAGELTADMQLGNQAGVITIESGGVQYECDIYSLADSSLLDYAVLHIKENRKWILYKSTTT